MGVTEEALALVAPITELLSEAVGGIPAVIKSMRFSDDPLIKEFFQAYDRIAGEDREHLPLEAICLKAEINPAHLLGSAQLAMREHSVNRVKIIAITEHPDILRKRIEYAKRPGGGRDRDAIDTALGFLPTNKGTTIINKMFAAAAPQPSTEGEEEEVEEMQSDVDYVFPDATRMQEKLSPIRQKMLEGGK